MIKTHSNILVVDDEPGVVNMLQEFLSLKGYEVHTASSGEEALQALKEWDADLIILDIIMPGLKGTEVAKIVKKQFPDTKIVIITAYPKESEELNHAHSMEAMLIKPFRLQELCKTLEDILSKIRPIETENQRTQIKTKLLFIKADLLLVGPTDETYNFLRRRFEELAHKGQDYSVTKARDENDLFRRLATLKPDIVVFEESYLRYLEAGIPQRILLFSHRTKEILAYDLSSTLCDSDALENLIQRIRELCIKNGLVQIR
jgi:CheY-like chemotaxis protein